jgi:branched-chain amino acid transport system permease protein
VRLARSLGWAGALAVLAAFPLVVTNPSFVGIAFTTLLYMSCTTSWNMFSGSSGYIALCAGVWYGSGAYTMALASIHWHMAPGAGMFWLVPLGGVVATAIAVPVGWVALRVRRHTFVVMTIAIFFIAQLTATNAGFTGGTSGLFLPYIPWNESYYNVPFYYVALAILLVATALAALVRRSRFGLQLMAIRDDEDRALGLGVRVGAVKVAGLALSAFSIGMAGALYAMFIGQIYPQFVFDPLFDLSVALMAFFGGLGTLTGPLVGGLVLESLQQWLTVTYSNGSLYLILFGSLFLLVVFFMPQGIVVFLRDWLTNRSERERAAVEASAAALGGS